MCVWEVGVGRRNAVLDTKVSNAERHRLCNNIPYPYGFGLIGFQEHFYMEIYYTIDLQMDCFHTTMFNYVPVFCFF